MEALADLKDWVSGLTRAEATPPLWLRVPPERVAPSRSTQGLVPSADYFCIRVHHIHLTYGREWFEKYSPLLLFASEFSYDGQGVTRPAVIGPAMIEKLGSAAPQSTSIASTIVAGPHPLREGSVSVTLALHKVSRGNVAGQFLDVVEGAGKALDLLAGPTPYAALARVVVAGATALTAGEGPIVARRDEFLPVEPGYFALIAPKVQVDLQAIGVVDGVLMERLGDGLEPFKRADHVLYSIDPVSAKDVDVTRMPLHRQWLTVLSEANNATTPQVWESAKTNLSTLIGMAFTSPDLTYGHAEALEREWTKKALERRESAQRRGDMGGPPQVSDEIRDRALAVLEL